MFQYLFPQELAVDMRIDFGGGNLFMSQHLLDSKQVGSPFQQVGGEGMAEQCEMPTRQRTGLSSLGLLPTTPQESMLAQLAINLPGKT